MPNFRKIAHRTTMLVATAAISSGVTYYVCTSHFEEERTDLNSKIRVLEIDERKAIVTQRVSEQMEAIAYQSKSLADIALRRANFERDKAEEQRQLAEKERHNALIAKDLANKAEQEARKQELIARDLAAKAEKARLVAQEARDRADTLLYLALGTSLAQKSLIQRSAGADSTARMLSYAGYKYVTEYGGSAYQQDVFTTLLYNASSVNIRIASFLGSVQAIKCIDGLNNKADLLVATDYGEVSLLDHKEDDANGYVDYLQTHLLSDKQYLFRDICIANNTAYILDVNGNLLTFDLEKKQLISKTLLLKAPNAIDHWSHLLLKKNGQLIAIGNHHLVWYDPKTQKTVRERVIDNTITEAGIGDGKLLVFTKEGDYYVFKEGIPATWNLGIPQESTISAYFYLKDKKMHAMGTDNGTIYLCKADGTLMYTLTGHTGPVSHIESSANWLVTSSYDRTVRIWNLNDISDGKQTALVVPLEIKCNAWPVNFSIDPDISVIQLGLSNGSVESIRYSADQNATIIHDNLKREFTPQEWQFYVGNGVPYRTFK